MIKVCVCTSNEGAAEPRAPRHAAAIAELGSDFQVMFIDSAPIGHEPAPVKMFCHLSNVRRLTHRFSSRAKSILRLAVDRGRQQLGRIYFKVTGLPTAGALSTKAFGLERDLLATNADFFIAHNVETLLPAVRAAARRGSVLIFDSMEFHSDMGDGQSSIEQRIIRAVERHCLPKCALVLASSDQIADALVNEYRITRPLPLFNVPPEQNEISAKPDHGLALYWRNAVVGLGQRGLDEALVALTKLPEDVSLNLQGRMPRDGGDALKMRIAELGLQQRVIFHRPYSPDDAVKEASQYHIGLCLERPGIRNHELTVSNKIFDYHMAGLAIVASDLPALRSVLERSGGGLLFEPGSATDLAKKILTFYNDRESLNRFATSARQFAMREGNREVEMKKFIARFRELCSLRTTAKIER